MVVLIVYGYALQMILTGQRMRSLWFALVDDRNNSRQIADLEKLHKIGKKKQFRNKKPCKDREINRLQGFFFNSAINAEKSEVFRSVIWC